jgi:hypothetical protein
MMLGAGGSVDAPTRPWLDGDVNGWHEGRGGVPRRQSGRFCIA